MIARCLGGGYGETLLGHFRVMPLFLRLLTENRVPLCEEFTEEPPPQSRTTGRVL